jgi:DNA-binding NarL/FixJ family response regulator
VKHTHVLLSGAPGLVREIVSQIVTSQQDMTLVDTTEDVSSGVLARHGDVDVVVILIDGSTASPDAAVTRAFSPCAVVVLRGDGAWSYEHEVRRVGEIVGELTPDAVAGAIRSAAKRRAASPAVLPAP